MTPRSYNLPAPARSCRPRPHNPFHLSRSRFLLPTPPQQPAQQPTRRAGAAWAENRQSSLADLQPGGRTPRWHSPSHHLTSMHGRQPPAQSLAGRRSYSQSDPSGAELRQVYVGAIPRTARCHLGMSLTPAPAGPTRARRGISPARSQARQAVTPDNLFALAAARQRLRRSHWRGRARIPGSASGCVTLLVRRPIRGQSRSRGGAGGRRARAR